MSLKTPPTSGHNAQAAKKEKKFWRREILNRVCVVSEFRCDEGGKECPVCITKLTTDDVECGNKRKHYLAHDPTCELSKYYELNKLYNDIEKKKREIQRLQMELDATIKEKFGPNLFRQPMPPAENHRYWYRDPPMNPWNFRYQQNWNNYQYFPQWNWSHNNNYAQPRMVPPTNFPEIAGLGVPGDIVDELLEDESVNLENL